MKYLVAAFLTLTVFSLNAQDFNKHLATARASYSSKKLDDARFAMQQMLQELDIMAGKDILKLLPVKFDALSANIANDNVMSNSGFAGIMIQRDYGAGEKTAEIQIIGNSPLMASVNAILSLPFGNSSGNQKVIKLEGYKALFQKHIDQESNKVSYEIQIPLNASLLSFKANGLTEDTVLKLAATIPVGQLASMIQ
ncbi:MAG: hypothetical protein H7Y13_08355 [Sphingobacteriaceae bacterium]|nr:hypothetical protein [Sphingobacteriaceae bacterium]